MREDLGVGREFISAFCAFAGPFFLLEFFSNFFSVYLLKLPPPPLSRGSLFSDHLPRRDFFFLPDIVDPNSEQLSILP